MLLLGKVDDRELTEELRAFQKFLVEIEPKNGRHRVIKFNMSTFNDSLVNENLECVFEELECAPKINLVLGNNTVMEKSELVCSVVNINYLKERLEKINIVGFCTRER